jgi:hypothetical protein
MAFRLMTRDQAAEAALKAALEAEAHKCASYALLLREGTFFEPRHRPASVPVGEKRYCFRNAYRLASERPDLAYVEGYGVSDGFESMPTRHAWCTDAACRVFDPTPTWADPERPLMVSALCGIAMPLAFVGPYVDREELHCGTFDQIGDDLHLLTEALGLDPLP